jgi:tetratricopeptide (TPR) repeat protein
MAPDHTPKGATVVPPARALLDDGLNCAKAGMLDRALDYYAAALDAAEEPAHIAVSLRRRSHVYRMRCEWEPALEAARQSVEVATTAALEELTAEALNAEAAVHQSRGDFDLATPLYERILTLTVSDRVRGVALQNLAGTRAMQSDLQSAEQYFREAHDCFERAGYEWGRAHVLNNLGRLALDMGKRAAAESLLVDGIEEAKRVGDLELIATARMNLAEALVGREAFDQAEECASAALGHFTTEGNEWRRVECFRLLGDMHAMRGAHTLARSFFDAAMRVAVEIGAKAEQQKLQERLSQIPI